MLYWPVDSVVHVILIFGYNIVIVIIIVIVIVIIGNSEHDNTLVIFCGYETWRDDKERFGYIEN